MKPIGWIYLTTNLVNGKIYIGQHVISSDKRANATYIGSGELFKRALNKYGKENFKRKILRVCYTQKELNTWEYVYIKKYKSQDKNIGYNIADGDILSSKFNPAKLPEVRKKISESRKGRFAGKNNPMYGYKFSEEQRERMSEVQKGDKSWMFGKRGKLCHNFGRKLSNETRKKISEKLSGENNPNYGKRWSDEVKYKISLHHADFSGDKNPMFGKRGIDSPMYNRKWINNGQQEKFVNLRDNELPQGYSLGRLKHKTI